MSKSLAFTYFECEICIHRTYLHEHGGLILWDSQLCICRTCIHTAGT